MEVAERLIAWTLWIKFLMCRISFDWGMVSDEKSSSFCKRCLNWMVLWIPFLLHKNNNKKKETRGGERGGGVGGLEWELELDTRGET